MGRVDSGGWTGNAVWIVLAAAVAGALYYFVIRPRLVGPPPPPVPALVSIPCRDACRRAEVACVRDQSDEASGRISQQCAVRRDECIRRCAR